MNPDGSSGLRSLKRISINTATVHGSQFTYCVCQQGRCVLGAYHRCWLRRQMMNNPNQKAAITRAGTRVVRNAESDVEPPIPRSPATSELPEDAFPRDEPTFGSLLGSCLLDISTMYYSVQKERTAIWFVPTHLGVCQRDSRAC